jgi:hypothetical protein
MGLFAGLLALFGAIGGLIIDADITTRILLWAAPLTVLCVALIVGILYSVWTLLRENRRIRAQNNMEHVDVEVEPCIRFLGWETVEPPIEADNEHGIDARGLSFTRISFANRPDEAVSVATARSVVGHVEFFEISQDNPLFSTEACWTDLRNQSQNGSAGGIDLEPDGKPHCMDIVIKHDEDDICYGMDSRNPAPDIKRDWRDASRQLDVGLFNLKVVIRGENVDETFWLGLINRGKGQQVRILHINR